MSSTSDRHGPGAATGSPRAGALAEPAFLLSTERSGSTLLRWLLDAHPEIVSPGEILLGRLCFDLYFTLLRTVVATLDLPDHRARNREALRRTREIIDGIMTTYAHARGKRIWCDKTPLNLSFATLLVEAYPDARYVCLTRDGLDVAHSCLTTSREGFMAELTDYVRRSPHDLVGAMLESWCEKTEQMLAFQQRHPTICHRIRYEDLVTCPSDVLPGLLAFLGVDWDPAMLERAFTMRHDDGGGDQRVKLTTSVESDRTGRGRTLDTSKLTAAQRGRANALLRKLGYAEIEEPTPLRV